MEVGMSRNGGQGSGKKEADSRHRIILVAAVLCCNTEETEQGDTLGDTGLRAKLIWPPKS